MCFISSGQGEQTAASLVSFADTVIFKYPYIIKRAIQCLVLGEGKPLSAFCLVFPMWAVLSSITERYSLEKSLRAHFPEPLVSLICFQVRSGFEMAPDLPHQQMKAYYITVRELLLPVCHFKSSMQDLTRIPGIPGVLPLRLECQTSLWELCRLQTLSLGRPLAAVTWISYRIVGFLTFRIVNHK